MTTLLVVAHSALAAWMVHLTWDVTREMVLRRREQLPLTYGPLLLLGAAAMAGVNISVVWSILVREWAR